MASQDKILEEFKTSSQNTLTPKELADLLKQKVSDNQSQLDRMVAKDPPLLVRNEDGSYSLTNDGRSKTEELTMETAKLTPFQQFKQIGVQIGIKEEMAELITAHVFRNPDYRDLKVVWSALNSMAAGMRPDLMNMWFQAWQGVVQVPMPPELEGKLPGGTSQEDKKKDGDKKSESKEGGAKEGGTGLRDYILDDHENPLRVGEDNGSLTYEDAVKLSQAGKLGIARGAGGKSSGDGSSSSMKEMTDAFKTMFELANGNGNNKKASHTFVTHPDENGQTIVEEVEDDGKPLILPQGGGPPPQDTLVVHENGETEMVPANRPIIITPRAAKREPGSENDSRQKYMVYDPTNRQLKPWDGVSPIELGGGNGNGQGGNALVPSSNPTIPFQTPDGKPFTLDLNTYFRLEEHKQKLEQDAESHGVKMDIAKGARELINKGIVAFSHMDDKEEEGK